MPASPLSRAEREQRKFDLEARRLLLLEEHRRGETFEPCSRHPAWQVSISNRRVPPPASQCPYCLREAQVRHATQQQPTRYEEVDPWDVGDYSDRVAAAIEDNAHRFGPLCRPSSSEEEFALERIDELREDELALEQKRPNGRRVSGRIEGGRWVETWKLPGRNHFVRVGAR